MTDETEFGIHGAAVEPTASQGFVGNDPFVASPMGFTQAVHLGEFTQQQEAGRTTLTKHDTDLAMMHAENAVKSAMAAGGDRDAAIAAASHYANGNPELTSLLQDAAAKQYDSNKNPLAAAAEATAGNHSLGAMLGFGAATEAAQEPKQAGYGKLVLDDHERGSIMSTTATIAALGQFSPQPGLPVPQRNQGLQIG